MVDKIKCFQLMRMMTEQQAYSAMFFFLEQLYKRAPSDELGSLLGAMTLLGDGSTADPAIREDWGKAVEYAMKGGGASPLRLNN